MWVLYILGLSDPNLHFMPFPVRLIHLQFQNSKKNHLSISKSSPQHAYQPTDQPTRPTQTNPSFPRKISLTPSPPKKTTHLFHPFPPHNSSQPHPNQCIQARTGFFGSQLLELDSYGREIHWEGWRVEVSRLPDLVNVGWDFQWEEKMGGTIFFWLGGIRNNLPNMRFYHLGNIYGIWRVECLSLNLLICHWHIGRHSLKENSTTSSFWNCERYCIAHQVHNVT